MSSNLYDGAVVIINNYESKCSGWIYYHTNISFNRQTIIDMIKKRYIIDIVKYYPFREDDVLTYSWKENDRNNKAIFIELTKGQTNDSLLRSYNNITIKLTSIVD